MRKTLFWIMLYLAATLADGLCTWLATPDLSREGNPLVAVLGFGWGALFLANLIVFVLASLVIWYAYARYRSPLLEVDGGVRRYVSMLLFGRPDRFYWILYKLRCNWRAILAALGFALPGALVLARVILVSEWLVYLTGNTYPAWYNSFKHLTPYGRTDILLMLLLFLGVFSYWFYREYRRNRRVLARAVPLPEGAPGCE